MSTKRAFALPCIALVLGAWAAPAVAAPPDADQTGTEAAKMHGVRNGQNGIVKLTEGGDGTLVVFVLLQHAAGTFEQPTINRGTCAKIGAPLKPLETLSDGKSMSSVSSLNFSLIRRGEYAVVVDRSPTDKTVVSCGNVGRGAQLTSANESGPGM